MELKTLLGLACAVEGAVGLRIIGYVSNSMHLHALSGGRGRITIKGNTKNSMGYRIRCISIIVVVAVGGSCESRIIENTPGVMCP